MKKGPTGKGERPPSIKKWAEDDRPREKLIEKGKNSLSNAELMAILIRSGSQYESAVDLSKRILAEADHNWNELARFSVDDLCRFKGIGPAKAISIVTALELGRRRQAQKLSKKPKIQHAKETFLLMHPLIGDLQHEEFWMLYLNSYQRLIHKEQLSKGGINYTSIDLRLAFRKGLEKGAVLAIACHNHPAGNLKPSKADCKLTEEMKKLATLAKIQLFDHIIITQKSFYSFLEKGTLYP